MCWKRSALGAGIHVDGVRLVGYVPLKLWEQTPI